MSASSSKAAKHTSVAGGDSDWSGITDDVLYKAAIDTKLSTLSPLLAIHRKDQSQALLDLTHHRIYSLRFPWSFPDRRIVAYSHPHLITDTTQYGKASIHLRDIFTGAQTILPAIDTFSDLIRVSPSGQILLLVFGSSVLLHLNVGDTSWTVANSSMLNTIRDMIFFQVEWLALTKHMELLAVELRGRSLMVRESRGGRVDDSKEWGFANKWLGEFDGVLFAVCMNAISKYDVFQWDSGKKGWEETRDVGDKALFLSLHGRLVMISATRFGLRKNCLYTINHHMGLWNEFWLEDRSLVEVNIDHPDVLLAEVQNPHPVWVFPNNR